MASTLKTTPRAAKTPHDADLSAWVAEQVALLRARRFDEIDADNIAEELGDVGRAEHDKLESALAVLLMHMLKWDHQPGRRSRSWHITIAEQRRRVARVLKANPSLKAGLSETIVDAYLDGRGHAAIEMDCDETTFPAACPYQWQDITGRPFILEPAGKGR